MNSIRKAGGCILLWASMLYSCYQDTGNYDYNEINEVTIGNIKDEYEIIRWDTLRIQTVLDNSLKQDSNFVYAWYLDNKKIADTRHLDYIVSEKAKLYEARFEVMDPEADSVRFFKDFKLTVHAMYAQGLLLLSDCEETPELSFMSTLENSDKEIMRNVFELENAKALTGKPLGVEQPNLWSYGGTIFVHTSEASYELDPVYFRVLKCFDENSYTESNSVYDMVFCSFEDVPEVGSGVAISSEGCMYRKLNRQDRYMQVSLKPIYVYGEEELMVDYQLSPMAMTTRSGTLAYDNLSGRFMYFSNSYEIPSYDENQYDEVQISDTHIGIPWLGWGVNMSSGYYNLSSLFYDKTTGQAALARAHTSTGVMKGADSLVVLSGHHLAENSCMALNSANNELYYSDGGHKIYMLNLSDPAFEFESIPFECSLPETCRITLLKVASDNMSLYVGVVSNRADKYNGDIYKLSIKTGEIQEYLQGFGGVPVSLIEKIPAEYEVEEY